MNEPMSMSEAAFQVKQMRFRHDAETAWAVYGHKNDFAYTSLMAADYVNLAPERAALRAKGFHYCGAVGFTAEHEPLILLAPEPESFQPFMHAVVEFVRQNALLFAKNAPDCTPTVEWLEQLAKLKDDRAPGGFDA